MKAKVLSSEAYDMEKHLEEIRFDTKGEPEICRHFGYGKSLTMEESRFGNTCADHNKKERIDTTMVLKFK